MSKINLSTAKQSNSLKIILTCFFIAVAFVAVGSKSSFIYPINDWGDANAYITVARMMLKGKVLYADIFEQKGLYHYLLHIPATLISYPGFFGVYLLETLALTFFLFFAYKSMALYLPSGLIPPTLAILAFITTFSPAFAHGDSAEELMLPFLAYSLYKLLQWSRNEDADLPAGAWIFQGIATAVIFWTKYTLLSFHIGFCLAILIVSVCSRDWKGLFRKVALWVLGIILGSLPLLFYCGLTHSFADMFAVYIRSNAVTYAQTHNQFNEQLAQHFNRGIIFHIGRFLFGLGSNPLITGMALVGFLRLGWARKNPQRRLRLAVRCIYGSMLGILIALPFVFNYYFLPLVILSILGIISLLRWVPDSVRAGINRKKSLAATILILAFLIPFSLASGRHSYLLLYGREDLPQYKFRKIIRQTPDPTLMIHATMDHGFQNVAEIVPDDKYFIGTNTIVPERVRIWRETIMAGKVDYIITNNQELEPLYPGLPYDLVEAIPHPYEKQVFVYRLYRRKTLPH
ncbi:MAG: hypothetical protein GX907_00745 [Clostridiaceae bacterium]|nr:hypothetical protein [Clostridiaceae bacterium]